MRNLKDISHFYFVGIGGIGMSALARYFHAQGKEVAGYDKTATTLTNKLVVTGIDIHYNDDYDSIPDGFKDPEKSLVVYTPAVKQDFGEMVRFRESGIPITKRAKLLGEISKGMTCMAIAGTHGKTTTSAILAHLLYQCGIKVTAFLGGILEGYDTNYLYTGTDVMVVEADEFDRSFLQLEPDFAGITAIDPDHLDIYGSEKEFREAFLEFGKLVPSNALFINESVQLPGRKIGVTAGDYHAVAIEINDGAYKFNLSTPSGSIDGWSLRLPGRHNLSNALLALSMAIEYGVDVEKLKAALASFEGVERRFTYKLNTEQRVVIDDYAHHPTEVDAVYQAVTEMYPDEKCTVIFQPHLYSRTSDFMQGFAESLSQFDKVGLLNIYAAREEPMEGVESAVLAGMIRSQETSPHLCTLLEKEDMAEFVREMGNRLVLLLGAGDIGAEVDRVTKELAV